MSSRFLIPTFLTASCLASFAQGCTRSDASASEAGAPAAAVSGCGKDYADPQKQFCLTLPAGYAADPKIESDELYSEVITFHGPNVGDGVTVTVGFTNSGYKQYEEQVASDESDTKGKDRKLVSSGATAGGGKWWIYDWQGTHRASAIAKAPNGKPLRCVNVNGLPSASGLATCKSLRPYGTKA
jgi:hypothetical protein